MKKTLSLLTLFVFGVSIMTFLSGCNIPRITETGRSAVEQLLLSGVVDLGIAHANFKEFSGKKIFVEYDYLAPQVDKPYVQGVFERHLAKNGIIVVRDVKEAAYTVQILCGVLATDTTKFNIGTPTLPIPLPETSLNLAIPEIALFQKTTRSGYGKFSFNVLDAQTRQPVKVFDSVEARTSFSNWVILLIPFKSHDMKLDIKEGTVTSFDLDWQ